MAVEGLIDLHHHVIPPALAETLASGMGSGGTAGLQMPAWSEQGALAFMDDGAIGVAVVSTGFEVHFGDDRAAVTLARRCNDFIADLARRRPDRFGGFGVLPLPLVDESIAEIERILDDLGLDGVMLSSNYDGVYLGDPRFDAVFDELERRGALVFVHPTHSPDTAARTLGIPDFAIDYVADTTRAIAKLHYSNTFARTPSVRYLFSHGGGTIPYVALRFDLLDSVSAVPGGDERGSAREQFRRLHFDTAIAFEEPVLTLEQSVIGTSQLVFGSDRPYAGTLSAAGAAAVTSGDYLSDAARAAIARGNAQRLIPRLAD